MTVTAENTEAPAVEQQARTRTASPSFRSVPVA
jgi:hypothetical protein